MYKYKDKIRYSHVDKKGKVPPYEILNFFQNCSTEQSEVIGKGVKYMLDHGKGWVIVGYKLVFERAVKYEDDIVIGTAPTGFKGFFARRKYAIMDESENFIVKADSLWTLIDMESRSPIRITEEEYEGYPMEDGFEGIKAERKLVFDAEATKMPSITVPKSFIDNNGHMNNANYLRAAYEYMEETKDIKEIQIAFLKEAVEGQEMIPYKYDLEDATGIEFRDTDGDVLCKVLVK